MKKKASPQSSPNNISSQLIYSAKVVVMFFFILFCFFNGVSSQLMPSLYFQFIKEEPQAELEFLKTARTLPEFQALYPEMRQTFVKHELEVFADERTRREAIAELETVLQENTQSRDVLYALAVLHKRNGNEEKSQEYYNRAKEIDPLLEELPE